MIVYLRKHGDMPQAMKAAKRDGFSAVSSAWLSALSKCLERGHRPGDMKEVG